MGKDEQTSTKIRGNPGALKDSEEARQTERSRDGVREASEGEPRGGRGCRGEGASAGRESQERHVPFLRSPPKNRVSYTLGHRLLFRWKSL